MTMEEESLAQALDAADSAGPGSPDQGHSPVTPPVEGLTRRFVVRILGLLGVSELAHQITSGTLPGPSSLLGWVGGTPAQAHELDESAAAEAEVDAAAEKLAAEAKKHVEEEGKSPQEALMMAIDGFGTLNFAMGVRDLLPKKIGPVNLPGKPVGHVNSTRYAIMSGLLTLKYVASDEAGRHHLETEAISSLKAFGIIAGTIVAAEGVQLDLVKAYEEAAGRAPSEQDRVALMTMLGSLVSPVITTVGSSGLIRALSNDLAKTGEKVTAEDGTLVDEVDHAFAAVAVSHVSNLSGYLLFGDPPFIAVCEKFGFQEGVEWQMNTMWPLALYSLLSSTVKLNYQLAQRRGLSGGDAWRVAVEDAMAGLVRNGPVLAKVVGKSLVNAAKYFSMADRRWAQDPGGIQVRVGEVMVEKITGMRDLLLKDAPPVHFHKESHEGIVHNGSPAQRAVDGALADILKQAARATAERRPVLHEVRKEDPDLEEEGVDPYQQLVQAIETKSFDQVVEQGKKLGIGNIELLVETWKKYQDHRDTTPHQAREGEEAGDYVRRSLWDHLSPEQVWERASNVDRVKGYLGHNLGDVVNVFPFQAGSVPFLTPVFQRAVNGLDSLGLSEKVKEMTVFFALLLFSTMADNYVACKIGLELLPEKPQIALIAAIQGGSMTAIGNMANVAQFNLDSFPLAASLAQVWWHADQVAMGLAWSQALGVLHAVTGAFKPPAVKGTLNEAHAQVDHQKAATRRGFLKLFIGA